MRGDRVERKEREKGWHDHQAQEAPVTAHTIVTLESLGPPLPQLHPSPASLCRRSSAHSPWMTEGEEKDKERITCESHKFFF